MKEQPRETLVQLYTIDQLYCHSRNLAVTMSNCSLLPADIATRDDDNLFLVCTGEEIQHLQTRSGAATSVGASDTSAAGAGSNPGNPTQLPVQLLLLTKMKGHIMEVKILVLKLNYIMFDLNFILNIYEFDLI